MTWLKDILFHLLFDYSKLKQLMLKRITMKSIYLFVICCLVLITPKVTTAQVINSLSPTSEFLCIDLAQGDNQVGRTTSTGYEIVSAAAVRKILKKKRAKLQDKIAAIKSVKQAVKAGDIPENLDLKLLKGFIKSFGTGEKFLGNKADKLEILNSNHLIAKGLLLLVNQELQALSLCESNVENDPTPGTYAAQIFVARHTNGTPFQVVAVLVELENQVNSGKYCIKKGNSPAYPPAPFSGLSFSSNPCSSPGCEGILGPNKVGLKVGGYSWASTPSEDEVNAAVGQLSAEFNESFQVRAKIPSNQSCPYIFGE